MITRFRLEMTGISHRDILRQEAEAVEMMYGLTKTIFDQWEKTDDVIFKQGPVYSGRVVYKRRQHDSATNV